MNRRRSPTGQDACNGASIVSKATLIGTDIINVIYTNDSGTRQVEIDYITVQGEAAVQAEGGAMIYDRGSGAAALDGLDITAPNQLMDVRGALRFVRGNAAYAAGYDQNGNMSYRCVQDQGLVLGWDAENRLTSITQSAGATPVTVASYVYDGDGSLVKKVAGGNTTIYIGDYYEKTGGIVRRYYYHWGQRVAWRDSALHYLLTDHLGSTNVSYLSDGRYTAIQRYYVWGAIRYSSPTMPIDYAFTGERLDGYSNLYKMGARWYDPVSARWISPDTIVPQPGNPQDLNRYSYVRNCPTKYIDPSGYDPLNQEWLQQFVAENGRQPTDRDTYLRLLSLLFPGSGGAGSWTMQDWQTWTEKYEEAMGTSTREFYVPTGIPSNGLQSLASHLAKLAAYYYPGEEGLFVRAVAHLWSGMSYWGGPAIGLAEITLRNLWRMSPLQAKRPVHLTPCPMLAEGKGGWNPEFVDDDNPSHHYAIFLASGYSLGYWASLQVNHARDADSPQDIRLGDVAAAHGSSLRFGPVWPFRGTHLASWVLRDFR